MFDNHKHAEAGITAVKKEGIGSHTVTCHPAEVTFPPLPSQLRLVLVINSAHGNCHSTEVIGRYTFLYRVGFSLAV